MANGRGIGFFSHTSFPDSFSNYDWTSSSNYPAFPAANLYQDPEVPHHRLSSHQDKMLHLIAECFSNLASSIPIHAWSKSCAPIGAH